MLAEISPPHIRGRVGVLNQLAIVFGILATQAVGMNYALPREWRNVLSASSSLGLVQVLLSFVMVDSPVWYKGRGKTEDALRVAKKLWKGEPVAVDIEESLEGDSIMVAEEEGLIVESLQKSESVVDVLMTMEYRRPLGIVALIMIAQQISGKRVLI